MGKVRRLLWNYRQLSENIAFFKCFHRFLFREIVYFEQKEHQQIYESFLTCATMNRFTSLLLLLLGLAVTTLWLPAQTIIQTPAQADSLRRVIATAKHDTTRVSAMNELAYYLCEKKSQYDSATAQARAALEAAERIGFRMGVASALQNIGGVLYRRGKYAEALGYFFKSLKLKEELADRGGMSKSLNTIALVYYTQGKNAEALENYFKSLRIREEIGDKSGIAMSLNNIANVYGDQGKNAEALEYFFKSLRIQEEIGDKSGIALSLNNIAIVYSDQGKNAEALENFFKSLRIQEEIGNKSGIANSLNNIGNTYKIMGQFKQAQPYLFRSLQLWKDLGRIGELSMTLNNLAISYRGQSKFDSAMVFSLRSLVLADSIGVKLRVKEALEELSIIMDSLGRHKESLAYFKRSTTVKDSLVNLENLNKTTQIKELYEAEKREQQIASQKTELDSKNIIQLILIGVLIMAVIFAFWFRSLYQNKNRANAEILRQQQTLENQAVEIELANTTLHERNLLLEELDREKNEVLGIAAHDLKNPLAHIILTTGTITRYYERMTDTELQRQMSSINAVAVRMTEIISNLLDVNAIERGALTLHPTHFDIVPKVNSLVEEYSAQANEKGISLHANFPTTPAIVFADKSATKQVLDNILSNAVKYSPLGKKVFIRVKTLTDVIRVEVQDEGEGISPGDMTKLFGKFARLSARPTGGEHSTGLGLSIVKKMVEAMNGRVWCESELGNGATFIVELPIVHSSLQI